MSEIEATRRLTRAEVADYLREFADQLDDRDSDPLSAGLYDETDERGDDASGERGDETSPTSGTTTSETTTSGTTTSESTDDRVTIIVGNDSATVNPTEEVDFGVQVGGADPLVGNDAERYVTFDLTWNAAEVEDDTLEIK